jgi:hypothetical protein
MKYYLGLFVLFLSFQLLASDHNAQLFLRARVPASYSVQMNTKKGSDLIVVSNTNGTGSQAKTKIHRYKNHYRVSIIQP